MKDWEKAEEIVAKSLGGRRTPGSGNKGLRGDVRKPGYLVEVKQTSKDVLTIKAEWLDELLMLSNKSEVAIAIFFDLHGYVYFLDSKVTNSEVWSTKAFRENTLPDSFNYLGHIWELGSIEDLKEW
jgi:Holliday junction resolvase